MYSIKQNCTPENGYNGQFYVCPCVPNHFSHVQLFATHGPWPSRFLCPWDFPGKNPGLGCHVLLQRIFLTQGSNPRLLSLLHWQVGSLSLVPTGKPKWCSSVQFSSVAQSCPTLGDPMDCSLPGSPVYGILQARILKWVAMSFSRGSS